MVIEFFPARYKPLSQLYKEFGFGHANYEDKIIVLEDMIENITGNVKPLRFGMNQVDYLYFLEQIYEKIGEDPGEEERNSRQLRIFSEEQSTQDL